MAIHVLDLMGKVASRFVHEILPVALASVIGALVVSHYGRQAPSPSIVVQAQPSASENAIAQSLREDHELIASFMKRNQERETDDRRSESVGTQVASVAPIALSLADPPLPELRPVSPQKAVARLTPKAPVKKKSASTEAPAPQSDPPAIASENPLVLAASPAPAQIEFEPRAQLMIRAASAFGGWVADVAQAPGRMAFLPHLPDWPSMPPLSRPLSFFREN
jgi:hypothetical protein